MMTIVDLLRGVKHSLRYSLSPTKETEEKWREVLQRQFSPEYMESMFFEDEAQVMRFLQDNIEMETSEEERPKVKEKIESLLGREIAT